MEMKKILIGIVVFLFLQFSASFLPTITSTYADPYDCLHYGTKQCITLKVSAACSSGKPLVTLTWNNPHNDSTFNIVYYHDGHWYMKPIWSKVLTTTIPPYGKYQDGGTTIDPGFLATGGGFGAKITGGVLASIGGSGITTGYSTPDTTVTMPNCTIAPPTNTSVPAAPTNTPIPSPISTPTTQIKVVLGLPGIGYSGGVPQHTTRPVTVELYSPTVASPGGPGTTPIQTATGTVLYDNGSDNNAGYFVTNSPVSFTNLPSGDYQILVKVPQYLYKLAINAQNTDNNHVFTLNGNTTTVLDPVVLPSGDVAVTSGQLNHLNILDYNILLSCYGDKGSTSSCAVRTAGSGGTNLADLNDDGSIGIVDLNIWLRSLKDLQTSNAPGCDTGDCQGD